MDVSERVSSALEIQTNVGPKVIFDKPSGIAFFAAPLTPQNFALFPTSPVTGMIVGADSNPAAFWTSTAVLNGPSSFRIYVDGSRLSDVSVTRDFRALPGSGNVRRLLDHIQQPLSANAEFLSAH